MRQLLGSALVGVMVATGPVAARDGDAVLRGVVGKVVSVALPLRPGYQWVWTPSPDQRLVGVPYRMRFPTSRASDTITPEIWTFPLSRPGRARLSFSLQPTQATSGLAASASATPSAEPVAKRVVDLVVLTPYEAQQHAPGDLRDSVLLR